MAVGLGVGQHSGSERRRRNEEGMIDCQQMTEGRDGEGQARGVEEM